MRTTTAKNRSVSRGQLVALADAAEEFSVSVKTIRRRIADGTVTGYRVGRLIRVDLDELRERLAIAIPSARP
ncbi:helix-turn-helix domain-containing protein [Cellulomonas sp. PhB143]|uniref:helix-turn-helix domain-containing protein n=1 Tax=Cellulomonas sp. PhB143 TaxID=2485186 RepID=UPI000F47E57D|nr:helix-turn-helix domain-containing protein [Cellulomonas sp. PhB143]ROS73078.1 excisionase family DNA binding protein [Cellulomonas sp. PhB143]